MRTLESYEASEMMRKRVEYLEETIKSALGYLSPGLCDFNKETCSGCAYEVQCAIAILEKAAKDAGK